MLSANIGLVHVTRLTPMDLTGFSTYSLHLEAAGLIEGAF